MEIIKHLKTEIKVMKGSTVRFTFHSVVVALSIDSIPVGKQRADKTSLL